MSNDISPFILLFMKLLIKTKNRSNASIIKIFNNIKIASNSFINKDINNMLSLLFNIVSEGSKDIQLVSNDSSIIQEITFDTNIQIDERELEIKS